MEFTFEREPNVIILPPEEDLPVAVELTDAVKCEKCFHELSVGEFPFCPHGFGSGTAVGDDIPGGMVMDHVEPGRKVYSKSELKAVLAKHGYQIDERHIDGGRVKDKFTSRWV